MERLDEGHLHPKLEVPTPETDMSRPGIKPGPLMSVGGEQSSKELFEHCINSNW